MHHFFWLAKKKDTCFVGDGGEGGAEKNKHLLQDARRLRGDARCEQWCDQSSFNGDQNLGVFFILYGYFQKIENGWFIMENLIKMDDLRYTPIFGNTHIQHIY